MATEKSNPLDGVFEDGTEEAEKPAPAVRPKVARENHKVETVTFEEFDHRNTDLIGRNKQMQRQIDQLTVTLAALRGVAVGAFILAVWAVFNNRKLQKRVSALEPKAEVVDIKEAVKETDA